MEIITLIILLAVFILLLSKGVSVDPINPYMILFSSMVLFLAAMGLIAEGLEIPTGDTYIQLNMSSTQINGTIVDIQEVATGIRATGFNIILLLLSLYLAYLSIAIIIDEKYGKSTIDGPEGGGGG